MNVYDIMYLSLWCSSPQDECMFNTLPYYITDLFIIAYMYPKVTEWHYQILQVVGSLVCSFDAVLSQA